MNELRAIAPMLFGINLITMLAVVCTIGIAPIITRKSLLFGVRIPEEAAKTTEAVKMKKNYIITMIIGGVLVLAILVAQYLLFPDISLLATLYLPLIMMAFQFITFVLSWKKATALKAKNNWTVPRTTTVDTKSAVQREQTWNLPKGWYIVSGLIVVALIVLSLVKYPSLPPVIPTNWGVDMKPDAWTDKSFWSVLMMPIITVALLAGMMLGNIVLYRTKLQVSSEKPEVSYAQHRIYRKMMSEALGIMTLILTIFLGVFQLMTIDVFIPSQTVMVVMTIVMIVASCFPCVYVYFKAGQGGCKLDIGAEDVGEIAGQARNDIEKIANTPAMANGGGTKVSKATLKFNRGDDKFWKLGMFYYNEDDPAMFVEDRFGTNSGFNYARTSSKVITALLIVTILAVYIGTTIMFFGWL